MERSKADPTLGLYSQEPPNGDRIRLAWGMMSSKALMLQWTTNCFVHRS